MTNRIVVLGGSFNPPTIAHLELMRSAMDAIDACQGLFVPTAQAYVSKKMKKQRCPQDTLGEDTRVEMLESLCLYDARLSVSRIRLTSDSVTYDYEMLDALQNEWPDAALYFLTGSDKLYALPVWRRVDELISRFHVLVARRGEDDLEKIKSDKPFIAAHWDAFTVFDAPEAISAVSSSAFRNMLRDGDRGAQALVTKEVWEIMNNNGRIPWNSITNFHEERYAFLSNFYEAAVTYGGLTYGSNEAAFQAQKCMTEAEKLPFTEARPSRSKGMGRRVALRPDWETVKAGIMEEIVRAKFTQHPELAERLLATGEMRLIEGNTWGDVFWGVDIRTGKGENHLGQALMKVREELRHSAESLQ